MPPAQNKRHRQTAGHGNLLDQTDRSGKVLGPSVELSRISLGQPPDVTQDGTEVTYRLHDVARTGLPLGADHRRPFGDAAQGLTQVGGPTHEGDLVTPLVDVMSLVGGSEHFTLVDVVDPQSRQHLGLGEVTDAGLGHHRDGHRRLDPFDEGGVAHPSHPAVTTDVGRHPLEGHHRHRPGILGHLGLCGIDHIHDDAAAQHFGQPPLDRKSTGGPMGIAVTVCGGAPVVGHAIHPTVDQVGGPPTGTEPVGRRTQPTGSDDRVRTAGRPRARSRCPPSWPPPGRRPP